MIRGIVLRETAFKENDKILTLLTDGGTIPVIARGVRRKNCRFTAAAQPLVYAEWTLTHRGKWYYANDGATLELFAGLRDSLPTLSLGCYFAELTGAVAVEGEPSGELLRHLLNGLYVIGQLHKPLSLSKAAFELRLLCLSGYTPLIRRCTVCGCENPAEPVLDTVQGTLRCKTCGTVSTAFPLDSGALAAMRHIAYGDPKRQYAFQLGEPSLTKLSQAVEQFLMAQLDRGFQTLDFYKSIL